MMKRLALLSIALSTLSGLQMPHVQSNPLEAVCWQSDNQIALGSSGKAEFCSQGLATSQVYQVTLGWESRAMADLDVVVESPSHDVVVQIACSNISLTPRCVTKGSYRYLTWGSASWNGGEAVVFLFKSGGTWTLRALAGPAYADSLATCADRDCGHVGGVRAGRVMARIEARLCDPWCD